MFDPLGSAPALQAAAANPAALTEGELIDAIRAAEEVKAAAAAAQVVATQQLAALRWQREEAEKLSARRRGIGLGAEVGLARRESPVRGNQALGLASALAEMPHTFRALAAGRLSEWRATLLVRETAYLSREGRQQVDNAIAADTDRIDGWGDRRLVAEAQRLAYALEPEAVTARARRAEADRHVGLRPAPDVMSRLSALLPVAQGVACYASLKAAADAAKATGDERSRGQLMADTLVERLTGRTAASGPDIAVNLTITDRSLFAGDAEPAHLEGYGTVPAQWARDVVRTAAGNGVDQKVALWFRALYTHPVTGALLAASSRRRCAPPGIAALIATRDRTCRTPWCDAPIRHTDHVLGVVAGGATTTANTQGLCESCNHTKAAPGWTSSSGRSSPVLRHLVVTRTPTGHVYRSTAPPGLGHEASDGETYQAPGLSIDYQPA